MSPESLSREDGPSRRGLFPPNRMRLGIAASLALLAGCQEGGGSSVDAPPPKAPESKLPAYALAQEGDPLHAAVTLDSSRSASRTIPLEGGSITVTASDGSTYTLTIPANALEEETRITLIPVAQLSDLPFGETGTANLGVQMEPSGLRFLNPATLAIAPSTTAEIPLERQLFVQWDGSGANLAFAAPDPKSRPIRLSVPHFSGMGVVRSKGLDADIEAVRARIGGDAERRIQSAVAEALTRERVASLLGAQDGESSALRTTLPQLFQQFHDQVAVPRIAAAGTSCAAGRLALLTLLGMERQLQLLGNPEGTYTAEINRLVPVVAEVCMKEEFEICRDEHLLTRILPARLGLERQAQLLGVPEGSFAFLDKYVAGCLKFELDFRSTSGTRTDEYDVDEGVQALKVRLQWKPALGAIATDGPTALQSLYYDVSSKQKCISVVEPTRIGSTFDVTSFGFVPRGEDVQDFKLTFDAGLIKSNFKVRDDCSDPPQVSPQSLELNYSTSYGTTRVLTAGNPVEAYTVTDWTVQKAAVLATKSERATYQVDGTTSLYYDDKWEIRHVPGL